MSDISYDFDQTPKNPKMPFGDCKNANLRDSVWIQSAGMFIGIEKATTKIICTSPNIQEVFGIGPNEILKKDASEVLKGLYDNLLRQTHIEGQYGQAEYSNPQGVLYTLVAHQVDEYINIEIEQGDLKNPKWWDHQSRLQYIDNLAKMKTLDELYQFGVDFIAKAAGLDRVMLYKFLPNYDGEVVAEKCRAQVEGFQGLRFPAADLPPNTRQLYTLNVQRMIHNVHSNPIQLIFSEQDRVDYDLTYSQYRAVHQVHLQYLKNMGVGASLSMSVVIHGRLWGLFACHQMNSLELTIKERLSLVEVIKQFALHLNNLVSLSEQESHSLLRQRIASVKGALHAFSENPEQGIVLNLAKIKDLFGSQGAWLHFQNHDHMTGMTPDVDSLRHLSHWLETQPKEEVSYYNHLPRALNQFPAIVKNASGLIYIPLSPNDYLCLFRPEWVQMVNWAGKPSGVDGTDTVDLTPRKSFQTWTETVKNSSQPWLDVELNYAHELRTELLEYISRARLEYIALHDSLTGLANRLLFEKTLHREIRNTLHSHSQFAVHMIDLDKFKPVNDNFGHSAGDELLRQVSKRLSEVVRSQDLVARLGGDEFAILQVGVVGQDSAEVLGQKIVNEICEPFNVLGNVIEIGASIGISLFPKDTSDEKDLLDKADQALYTVKEKGRNDYCVYNPSMSSANDQGDAFQEIQSALDEGQFEIYYQPIFKQDNQTIRGLESFLRWNHPTRGLLCAAEFYNQIEKHKFDRLVNEWTIQELFKTQKHWLSKGLPPTQISMNVNYNQLVIHNIKTKIQESALHYDLPTEWLRLDVNEETILKDFATALKVVESLNSIGVGCQLDHFGDGIVSLGFLSHLPFVGIKFDTSYLATMSQEGEDEAVLSVIKGVATILHAKLSYTKVETEQVHELLKQYGGEGFQGYYYAKPMPAREIEGILAKG